MDEDPTTSVKANGGVSKLHVSKKKDTSPENENDPQLQEFLEVMQPRSKSKIWGNDTTLVSGLETKVLKKEKKRDVSKNKASVEVKTVESFSRRVPINKGKGSEKLTQLHVRFEGSDSGGSSDDELYESAPVLDTVHKEEVGLDKISSLEITPEDPLLNDETVTDLDYFKSRTKSGDWSDEDEAEAKKDEAGLENASAEEEDEEEDEDEDEDEREEDDDKVEDKETGSEDNAMAVDKDTNIILAETEGDDTERNTHHDKDEAANEQEYGVAVVAVEEQESVSETGRLFVRNLPYTAT